jgi:hypothetical protein
MWHIVIIKYFYYILLHYLLLYVILHYIILYITKYFSSAGDNRKIVLYLVKLIPK